MVSVPIISGISANGVDFRTAYPVNLIPVPKDQGISAGYLRPAEGIIGQGEGPGPDRGAVRWNDSLYRVMGSQLCLVSDIGAVTVIGFIAGSDFCTFDNSFDYLAINGGGKVYLYNGATLAEITDPDLGPSLDIVWVDGYFMSTDGEFLIVTDLNDPFSINPLKYGSSEINPDPVVALQKLRNEVYALNRYTIEVFDNVGGSGFPFARIDGAQIMKGAVGPRACTEFMSQLAFLGGGFNEPNAIWVGSAAQASKISTREIDDILRTHSDTALSAAVMESRSDRGHEFLYIHLADQTLAFDGSATAALGQPVWFILQSGVDRIGYRARGMVWCYNRWNVGDPFSNQFGYLDDATGEHFGELTTWEFSTPIVYNDGRGVIIHDLELIALSGDVALGDPPVIGSDYSLDGETWSQRRYVSAGRVGERTKRLMFYKQGALRTWRIQRFTGDSRAHLSFARLEATMEPLSV
jgi:hypothetical protein